MVLLKKLLAVYKIIRPLNFVITVMSVIVAYMISRKGGNLRPEIILAALSGGLAGAGGNVINDYYDLEIDKINRPDRILPSGQITLRGAFILYIFLVLLSLDLAFWAGVEALIFVLFSTVIIFIYSYKLKRVPLAGNFTVSFMTGMAFIYGGLLADNIGGGIIPAIFALLINFVREVVKDIEDIEGDRKIGIVTFPIIAGSKKALNLATGVLFLLMLFTFYPYISGVYKIEYFIIVMLVVNPLLIIIYKLFYLDNSKRNMKNISGILKIAMIAGLVAIYAGV